MMEREALEKCMVQWTKIYHELLKMDAMQRDGELDAVPTFSMLKRKVLSSMGIPTEDHPINWCYLCEHVQTEHPTPGTEPIACEYCSLKGYAWTQCEADGPYLACYNEYDDECFGDAAGYAQEIIDACDRALEDLDNEE